MKIPVMLLLLALLLLSYCNKSTNNGKPVDKILAWDFPLDHPHEGVLLGNGEIGAMIWGGNNILKITFGKADFWDYQGGHPLEEKYSYENLLKHIEDGTLPGVYEELRQQRKEMKPSVLPIGRFELHFEAGVELVNASLNINNGILEILLSENDQHKRLTAIIDQRNPVLIMDTKNLSIENIKPLASWEFPKAIAGMRAEEPGLERRNIPRPIYFKAENLTGWVQKRPVDPALCVGYAKHKTNIVFGLKTGATVDESKENAGNIIQSTFDDGLRSVQTKNLAYWEKYWRQTPAIHVPDTLIQTLYDYGMYKLATATKPGGIAMTLQGPWIEDYQMPPWLSDYHYNINVQMMYWQTYKGNHLDYLLPLFTMLENTRHQYMENAKIYLGIDDGIKITHAMDDRGNRLIPLLNGGYMDPGSSAWPALMMWRYFEYSLDSAFLRKTAIPFMQGAFNAYFAMLREDEEGTFFYANSPEYYTKPKGEGGIGRNPTFQLVLCRLLAENLIESSEFTDLKLDGRWEEVLNKLPESIIEDDKISVWEGQPYTCHRHYSHLVGIYPFDYYDRDNPTWQQILDNSYREWIIETQECKAGWSYPWEVAIHSRFGQGTQCVSMIHEWAKNHMNKGFGTMHNKTVHNKVLMQLDAGFGMTAAIMEMLVHDYNDVIYLFHGIPDDWENVRFENILLPKRTFISADKEKKTVELKSEINRKVFLHNYWNTAAMSEGSNSKMHHPPKDIIKVQLIANKKTTVYFE